MKSVLQYFHNLTTCCDVQGAIKYGTAGTDGTVPGPLHRPAQSANSQKKLLTFYIHLSV